MTAHQTEHAALVALLRTRPNKLTWRKLTDRVLADGSAVDVWHNFHPESRLELVAVVAECSRHEDLLPVHLAFDHALIVG
jgi:hypothetical protein